MEDDDLDLMLPVKKKKPKKVEFVEEGDAAEKDDGELRFCSNILKRCHESNFLCGTVCTFGFIVLVFQLWRTMRVKMQTASRSALRLAQLGQALRETTHMTRYTHTHAPPSSCTLLELMVPLAYRQVMWTDCIM